MTHLSLILFLILTLPWTSSAEEDFFLTIEKIPFNLYEEVRCGKGETCYYYRSHNPIQYHGRMGFEHIPSITFRESLRAQSELVYNVTYKINEHKFRASFGQGEERRKFALFFGGSFTFGQGINDYETLPSQFAIKNTDYEAYNFGINGAGLNTMLSQIFHFDLQRIVKQREGVAIYVYFEEHVARALGNLPSLGWLRTAPFFSIEDLSDMGKIEEARPLRTKILLFIQKYIPGMKNRIFPSIGSDELHYACRLFERAKVNLNNKLGKTKMIVLQHPFYGTMNPELKDCLREKSISVVESDIMLDQKYKLPYDGHPNALANDLISKLLTDNL